MKQEDFDTVTQLGTVAIKTIIIFLALIIAVGVGVYWYSAELERTTSNQPLENTTPRVDNNDQGSEGTEDEENEWGGTILTVDQEEGSLTLSVDGEQVEVVFTEDTAFTDNREESSEEPLAREDLVVDDIVLVRGELDEETNVLNARDIILVDTLENETENQVSEDEEAVTDEAEELEQEDADAPDSNLNEIDEDIVE